VERTFPLRSRKIEKSEVAAIGAVHRAKLYYLRGGVGKRARVRERRYGTGSQLPAAVEATLAETEDAATAAEPEDAQKAESVDAGPADEESAEVQAEAEAELTAAAAAAAAEEPADEPAEEAPADEGSQP